MKTKINLVEYSPLIGHHLPYLKILAKHFLSKNCKVNVWVVDEANYHKFINYLGDFKHPDLTVSILRFSLLFKVFNKVAGLFFEKNRYSIGVWGLVKFNLSTWAYRNELVFMTWLQHSCTQLPKLFRNFLLPKKWVAIDGFAVNDEPVLSEENFDRYLKSTRDIEIYKEPFCQAVLLLNERMTGVLNQRFPNTNFIKFPDFIETIEIDELPVLCRTLLEKANGRKIFLFPGRMIPKRNFICFLKIAMHLDTKYWMPCAIGELDHSYYNQEEWEFIQKSIENTPELLVIQDRPSDLELNALIKIADLLWLAYKNHPHSSNMLTRAATYQTAVVATAGSLIAYRVDKYDMGIVVNPYDEKKTGIQINNNFEKTFSELGFEQYAKEQSLDQLNIIVDKLLGNKPATSDEKQMQSASQQLYKIK